jgi:hypothetical protein
MKKIFLSLLLILPGYFILAQPKAISEFHQKYKDDGKYISVRIEGGLLKILSDVETNDEDVGNFLRAISGIESINLHKIDRKNSDFDEAYLRSLKRAIRREKFEELMVVRDGDTNVDFLVKEKKGKISDLLMMVDEKEEFLLLSFSGEIDLASLSELSDELDIEGAKHLKKIDKNR